MKKYSRDMKFDPNEELPLFVIGAGADDYLGGPNGEKLKSSVKAECNYCRGIYGTYYEEDLTNFYLKAAPKINKNDFEKACKTIYERLDFFSSVDEFINFYREDEFVCSVCKLIITKILLDTRNYEESSLEGNIKYSWLDPFFKFATKYLEKEEAKIRISRIPIITFNYDRGIEKSMNYINKLLFEQDTEILGNIFHFYGSFPAESDFDRTNTKLLKYSENIITYTDKKLYTEDAHYPNEIQETMVFLGFGYNDANMKLLARHLDKRVNKVNRIYGTSYGINEKLKENIIEKLSDLFYVDKRDIHLYDEKCEDFFNRFSSIDDLC